MDEIEGLKKEISQEKNKVSLLEKKLSAYEENGPAKLYYALTRKAWEMGDLLNAHNLRSLDLEDAKNKIFDRLKVVWNDASDLAIAIKTLGDAAGITGDEDKDLRKRRTTT